MNGTESTSIVEQLKAEGTFDNLRKKCLALLESNQSFAELTTRVESFTTGYLANIDTTNGQQPIADRSRVRDQLRTKLTSQPFFNRSVDNIIDQLLKQSNIASDVIDEIESKTCRLLGLTVPGKTAEHEDNVDIDEGADMSVPFENSAAAVDDLIVQNMDIDSDQEEDADATAEQSDRRQQINDTQTESDYQLSDKSAAATTSFDAPGPVAACNSISTNKSELDVSSHRSNIAIDEAAVSSSSSATTDNDEVDDEEDQRKLSGGQQQNRCNQKNVADPNFLYY